MIKVPKFSISILIFSFVFAFFGDFLYSKSPFEFSKDLIMLPPSLEHLFGTDRLGRDVLARVISGLEISLIIGFFSAVISALIGLIVGISSGLFSRIFDKVAIVIIDLFLTFPTFFLLLALVSYINASVVILIFVISITSWMSMARIIRSEAFAIAKAPFIKVLKIAKVSKSKIIFKYFTPLLAPIFLVNFTFSFSGAILAESSLSFLGLGVMPPQISLGLLLSEGKEIIDIAPWVSFFPGLFIFLITFSLINISDYLQSRFNQREVL